MARKRRSKTPTPPDRNPAAMPVGQLAALLTRWGSKPITVQMIAKDIADGCPANADGTISLLQYAAWHAEKFTPRAESG